MLLFFSEALEKTGSKKQDSGGFLGELESFIPENRQNKSLHIIDRLLMAFYWLKCEFSYREELESIAKKIILEHPDSEKASLISDLDNEMRWQFFPVNPWGTNKKNTTDCLSEWQDPKQFADFLSGFDEPFLSYFTPQYLLDCLEELENKNSWKSLLNKVKQIDLPTSLFKKHWSVTWLMANLQKLFLRFAKSEEPLACIYGTRQSLVLKVLEDIFEARVDALKATPGVIQQFSKGEINQKKIVEMVSQQIGFSKNDTNLEQILNLAQTNLAEIFKTYLNSYSNRAAEYINDAGNGCKNGIEALDQICCLRDLLDFLQHFNTLCGEGSHRSTIPETITFFNYALFDVADQLDYFDLPAYAKEANGGVIKVNSEVVDLNVTLSGHYFSRILLHCSKGIYASISLRNLTSSSIENLHLKISVYGEKGAQEYYFIGTLDSEQIWQGQLPVNFSIDCVNNVEEPEPYSVEFRVISDEVVLYCIAYQINILPWNQYYREPFPEVLACFVTPNFEEIQTALIETRKILAERSQDSGTEGYQSDDKGRVLEMIKAVYDTVSRLEIHYNNPPSSPIRKGQKVRLPSQVLNQKQGTCLDLSVFMAAMLRAIGLYPVIIMVEGHAFPGCYLTKHYYSSCETNANNIMERLIAQQLVIFDSSSAAKKNVCFEEAQKYALSYLGDFQYMLDITAAHESGFWPINDWSESTGAPIKQKNETESPPPVIQEGRRLNAIEKFKIKLLNLSKSNPLINYNKLLVGDEKQAANYDKSKTSILLGSNNFSRLFERFTNGEKYLVQSSLSNWKMVFHYLNQTCFNTEQTNDEPSLSALLPFNVLTQRIQNIRKQISQELNQSGRSTFLLGIGFVRYIEAEKSSENELQIRFAPLLLLSVRLLKEATSGKAVIEYIPGSLQPNITLIHKLSKLVPQMDLMGLFLESQKKTPDKQLEWFFDHVTAALLKHEGFKFFRLAVLDFFPFNSFLMLQELEQNYSGLIEHRLMKNFLEINREETEVLANKEDVTDGSVCDDNENNYTFNEDFLLIDRADSTQLRAIKASLDGESFVLEGPPGTGKTTSITNIVALNILKGKKILFVAEKATAIDQLYKGLSKCGLDGTVLKVPENPDGRWLASQLANSLNTEKPDLFAPQTGTLNYTIEEWKKNASDLARLKEILASPCRLESFAYQILSKCINYADKPHVEFECGDILSYDITWYLKARSNLKKYFECLQIGIPQNQFLNNLTRCHQTDLDDVRRLVSLFERNLTTIQDLGDILSREGLPTPVKIDDLRTANHILCKKQEVEQNQLYTSLLAKPQYKTVFYQTRHFLKIKTRQEQNRADILRIFKDNIISCHDFSTLKEGFDSYYDAPNMFSKLWHTSFKTQIQEFLKNSNTDDRKISETLRLVADYRAKIGQINRDRETIVKLWQELGYATIDFESIGKTMDEAESHARSSAPNTEKLWHDRIVLLPETEKSNYIEQTKKSITGLYGCFSQLRTMLGLEVCAMFNIESLNELSIDQVKGFCESFRENLSFIEGKINLNSYLAPLLEQNLGDFVEKITGQNLDSAEVLELFDASFFKLWHKKFRVKHPEILNFTGYKHNQKRAEFENADNKLLQIAPINISQRILTRICDKKNGNFVSQKNYLHGLQNFNSVRISFRQLMNDLGFEFICNLKPCIMLSPMSIPEHIPLEFGQFDLVIFDEASQIESAYAISALRRAKQWIVAGDSKQLPPDKITGAGRLDEEAEMESGPAGSLESLLDECRRSLGNIHWLEWHYRSKDESLIAFSNERFYDGRLVTFPGADSGSGAFGVDYHKIQGGYIPTTAQSGGGTNPDEADFIVKYLIECINDPEKRQRSYGVITTNEPQAKLVMEKLHNSMTKEQRAIFLDEEGIGLKFTDSGSYEPIWVKPISRVQGDERDVVLITTVMSTNRIGSPADKSQISAFGILSEHGSERRLNVAFTRAREKMVVVTSMLSTDITSNAQNLGPKYLRSFLSFLETRSQQNIERQTAEAGISSVDYEKLEPMVADITRHLIGKGYLIENYLGNSSYKIEIAVRSTEDPEKYLLAIETDGKIYQKAFSARDRDILRPQVLKLFGWGDVYRVWLLEYLKNPDKEVEKIVAAIEAAKERPSRKPSFSNKLVPVCSAYVVKQNVDQVDDADMTDLSEPAMEKIAEVIERAGDSDLKIATNEDTEKASQPDLSIETRKPPFDITPFASYESYSSTESLTAADFDDQSPEGRQKFNNFLFAIVEKETPLTFDSLKARLRKVYQIGKISKEKSDDLLKRLKSKELAEKIKFTNDNATIWWNTPLLVDDSSFIPRSILKDFRPFNQVPVEEIQRALFLILDAAKTVTKDDLIIEAMRLFNIQRRTDATNKSLSDAINALFKKGYARFDKQTGIVSKNLSSPEL